MTPYLLEELHIKALVAYHALLCLLLYRLDSRYAVELGMAAAGIGIVMLSK